MTQAPDPHAPDPAAAAAEKPARLPDEAVMEATILELAAKAGPGKTIGPEEAARALMPPADWQRALPVVRRVAVRLARAGRLMIFRKGKPVDPDTLRGVFRLGLPRDD
ncbi:DUF3253 domain-containing protein [Xanthobacter tagetidis]|uniref:DUF3253 domain-containing protein n=1 Tax=Xanthobacter tagetidis TaxID=60216 RepID=A0A3L6ZW00_9HYPH|nr:hypothetical protein [Xanthobacter tagetidis]RLP71865.1 DUF3253 domain-containing protein [Xanthobacter tagetidis]